VRCFDALCRFFEEAGAEVILKANLLRKPRIGAFEVSTHDGTSLYSKLQSGRLPNVKAVGMAAAKHWLRLAEVHRDMLKSPSEMEHDLCAKLVEGTHKSGVQGPDFTDIGDPAILARVHSTDEDFDFETTSAKDIVVCTPLRRDIEAIALSGELAAGKFDLSDCEVADGSAACSIL